MSEEVHDSNIKQEKKKTRKKSKTNWVGSIILTIILTAAVILVINLLNGTVTVTGDGGSVVQTSSLTCNSSDRLYYIYTIDDSVSKDIEVKVLFTGEEFTSIDLTSTQEYDAEDGAKRSEAHNHAAMNISFANAGLGADAFNANYTTTSSKMIMHLYAEASEYNEVAARYFYADGTNKSSTLEDFTEALNTRGFSCTIYQ